MACAADSPTGAKTEEPAAPRAGDGFPPLLRAGIAYSHATHPGSSRYVLYEDSTFVLQGAYEYPGTYSRSDSELTFRFTANAGRWEAKGIVQDDLLFVTYNVEMQWDDFQNGVYRASSRLLTPGNIYLANPDGSDIARLTPGGWPSWSPDGKRIAFHRDGEIHVIDAVGSNEVRLVAGRFPTWSPDGRRIAFSNDAGIAVMEADGSGVTTLLRHDFQPQLQPVGYGVAKPTWSPDGKRIAFENLGDDDGAPSQIYIMNSDGSNPQRLTPYPVGGRYAESDPTWSSDGSRIAFWSYEFGIASFPASGGSITSIYLSFPKIAYGARPAWSPDGNSLAFANFAKSEIWTVSASGGGTKVLITGADEPAWSPRGGRIAFVSSARK